MDRVTDIHQKALSINLDGNQYGTIAEIGAGQETARWFFQVGAAAGTIAKAISAYDMKVSDAIYGEAPRYVSRERLSDMLAIEYSQVVSQLSRHRGPLCQFFAFANTVVSRSYSRRDNGHGWVGIRFQHAANTEASQIDVHTTLHGTEATQDQETVGILGVNLIYGAMNLHAEPFELLKSLIDGLSTSLLEIDMIDFHGPAFPDVDNRLMALHLVQDGLSPAAMFNPDGSVVHAADALYNKSVLVERSRFRPPTNLTINMLDCARNQFLADHHLQEDDLIVLSEMTLHILTEGEDDVAVDVDDFLQRVEILCALGKPVLISNLDRFWQLASYLFRHTHLPTGIVLGLPTMAKIFNDWTYDDLQGGILEAFGRLFRNNLQLYVSPALDGDGVIQTAHSFEPQADLHHLYDHLVENMHIISIEGMDESCLSIQSHQVLEQIRAGDADWEQQVPETVAHMIRDRHLFGCK